MFIIASAAVHALYPRLLLASYQLGEFSQVYPLARGTSPWGVAQAGLVGGKQSVGGHPAVFATLTAPSFGPVHTRVVNPRTGKIRPCRMRRDPKPCPHGKLLVCTQRHTENAPCLGRPIYLDCYDHAHHVVWNGWAGELWRRTTITLTRALRPLQRTHGVKRRVSCGKGDCPIGGVTGPTRRAQLGGRTCSDRDDRGCAGSD